MELIEGSETSAIRTQTPGNYRKENILHPALVYTPAAFLQDVATKTIKHDISIKKSGVSKI